MYTAPADATPHDFNYLPKVRTSDGWSEGTPVPMRGLVVDEVAVVTDPYGNDVNSGTVVYLFDDKGQVLRPESCRFEVWDGTAHARTADLIKVSRWQHPKLSHPVWEVRLQ